MQVLKRLGGVLVVEIEALRIVLHDGVKERPLFIGAVSSEILDRIAEVPSFTSLTSQATIAGNVLRPPIKDWQRPLNEDKRDAITRRYDAAGEFMPNPVLLSVGAPHLISVDLKLINGNQQTGVQILKIDDSNGAKPLWVLDGQHRIKGLAQGTKKANPVPFVLLFSEVPGAYRPEDSAKVFAEVSTEATPLSELHRDWLQFAFRLGDYNSAQPAPAGPKAQFHQNAMEVVALLCDTQVFTGGIHNPYFNCIQFNPALLASPVHGQGFLFSASSLKEWIFDEYYNQVPDAGSHLNPAIVASQIAQATLALISGISTITSKSAFFGSPNKRQQYIERAFICGVLCRLLVDPTPNWPQLLNALKFGSADWDFSWVKTTGGAAGNTSKGIARAVFCEAFRSGALPSGTPDLVSFLKGDQAAIYLEASHLTPTGQAKKADKKFGTVPIKLIEVFDTDSRPHVKLRRSNHATSNVGKLHIYDPDAPRGTAFNTAALKRGVRIPASQILKVHADTYGGRELEMELTIRVT